MSTANKTLITIEALVKASPETVWKYWTEPAHITQWNAASDDWHTTRSENDLRPGGKYLARMEAKDGSFGFEFWGVYDEVLPYQLIASTLGDGRKWTVKFVAEGGDTRVHEDFEAEETNPIEMQRGGWQAILNNFKKYVEAKG